MKRYPLTHSWQTAISDWEDALRAAGRSPATIETRGEHLRRFSRQTGAGAPGLVSRQRLTEWAASREWKAETRRSIYASLRGFYAWALESGIVADDITDALPSVKPAQPFPRPTPENIYMAALRAADERTRIVLRLAAEAGMRRGEIARVSAGDIFEDLSGWSLIAHGKGSKDRLIPLTDSLATELRRYLGRRHWLLPSPKGGHLTARHVGKIATRALPSGYTLHMLRHRFATGLHSRRVDLLTIQRLLGHASPGTTQRYILPNGEALRQAVNVLTA